MYKDICKQMIVPLVLLSVFAIGALAQDQSAASKEGEKLYREHCVSCHETGAPRVPNRAALAHLSMENFQRTLASGSMKTQAAGLSAKEIEALGQFLAVQLTGQAPARTATANSCPLTPVVSNPFEKPHWSGWGVDLAQTRFQPENQAQLHPDQLSKLKLKWAFGFPGADKAYSQPAVVGGRIFVGSANGKVYSLSAVSGCTFWEYTAEAPVRTAISVSPDGSAIYFGDQHASAYAVDAISGKLLWKTHVDEHPAAIVTGAPTLAEGKLFVPMSSYEELTGADPRYECCKFRGSVSALDASTGRILWRGFTIGEELQPTRKNKQGVQLWAPSGAAVWSSPTVDLKNRMVYVTTGDSYSDPVATSSDSFVAFSMDTGKLAWSRQVTENDAYTVDCPMPAEMRGNCPHATPHDFDFGSSPILVNLPNGGRALIAGQKSGMVHAVDPDHGGTVLWRKKVGEGGPLGGVLWGSATDMKNVYVALSDAKTQPVPAGTPGAQNTPFGMSFQLDAKAGGGLFALNLQTGETVWHTLHPGCGDKAGCSPAQSAAVTMIPGVIFSGGLDGQLRAYSAESGEAVWDIDTKQDYVTVNGVKANGGSIDGPGPIVVDGTLYVSSGYSYLGGAPGNVLLAFSVDGKQR
jgi:polyvinyl alcohol dehydrogenase (cytochrome)